MGGSIVSKDKRTMPQVAYFSNGINRLRFVCGFLGKMDFFFFVCFIPPLALTIDRYIEAGLDVTDDNALVQEQVGTDASGMPMSIFFFFYSGCSC